MSLKTEVGRANLIFSIGKIVPAVIAFFLNIYLARALQPYEYGLYSFAFVIIGTGALFTDLGINTVFFKFGSEEKYQRNLPLLKRLFNITFKYKLILSCFVSGIAIIFSDKIALFFGKPQMTMLVIISVILLSLISVSEYMFYFFTAMKSFKNQSVFRIIEQILKGVGIVFFVIIGLKAYGALIGIAIAYIILILVMGYSIIIKYPLLIRAKPKELETNALRTFWIWSAIGFFTSNVYGMIDRFMVSKMLNVDALGFYQIGYTWLFALTYIIPLAPQVMFTYYSSKNASKKHLSELIKGSVKYASIISFPFSFLLSAFSGAFIIFLYGDPYLPAAGVLKIMVLMVTPMLFVMFFSSYYICTNRQDIIAKICLISFFLLFITDFLLISTYGLIGAAYALIIVKIIELAMYAYILFFKERITFPSEIIWKPLVSSASIYFILDFAIPKIFKEISIMYFTLSCTLALATYVLLMLIIKGITKEELRMIWSIFR